MFLVESSLFDVRLTATDVSTAVETIIESGINRRSGMVCLANVDMVTRAKRDPALHSIMRRARLVLTDGAPLAWALRRNGLARSEQVRGPDLMRALCVRAAQAALPIFLYGTSDPDELALLVARLKELAPGVVIAGAVVAPMLPAKPPLDLRIVETINRSGARIVFVGLGCPKQEYWMDAHASRLGAVLVGAGYGLALVAGTKVSAPRWMQERSLEWLYRLWQDPRRLWKRYLIGNSLFMWYLALAWSRNMLRRQSGP